METAEFVELVVRDLRPLLAANAAERQGPSRRRHRGGRDGPGSGWIAIPGGGEVALWRSLSLEVFEAAIFRPYGDALAELDGVSDGIARFARDDVILRSIATQIGGIQGNTVEAAIRFLLRCASTTYEGQPVHLNLLLDLEQPGGQAAEPSLEHFEAHDWFAVLGSGLDSGILVDSNGGVVRAVDLRPFAPEAHGIVVDDRFRPDAFRCISAWTEVDNRVALSLARTGEVLIFQNGQLRYVHRSGRWRSIPATVALGTAWSAAGRMGDPLKRSVLATSIDASFGHHGACIAVIARGQKLAFDAADIVAAGDRWPVNIRARLMVAAHFRQLSRRQRLELVSMDGATVLDHQGLVLAAGAIVNVPGGSMGGGRLAAARALARYGAALKISQDGPVSLFGRRANGSVEQLLAFG